jgi:hypothetical protein
VTKKNRKRARPAKARPIAAPSGGIQLVPLPVPEVPEMSQTRPCIGNYALTACSGTAVLWRRLPGAYGQPDLRGEFICVTCKLVQVYAP